MAFTRLWQSSAETQDTDEFVKYGVGSGLYVNTNANSYTGSRSWRGASDATSPIGYTFSATSDIRANAFMLFTDTQDAATYPVTFLWNTPDGVDNYVEWDIDTNLIRLVVNGVIVDSIDATTAGFDSINTWYQIGLTLHCNASTGWVSFYLNGVQLLTWSGDTSTEITELYMCGCRVLATGWQAYLYLDDMYIDDATGEADASPPGKRFLYVNANGNGSTSAWTGSDGNSVDNYLHVDEQPPDDDTTYVAAGSNIKDDYAVETLTVPVNHTIAAVIPLMYARKTDAGIATTLDVYSYDGVTYQNSAAKALDINYAFIWDRQTLQPDTTAWNETDFNNASMVFGVEATGDFT